MATATGFMRAMARTPNRRRVSWGWLESTQKSAVLPEVGRKDLQHRSEDGLVTRVAEPIVARDDDARARRQGHGRNI